MSADSIDSSRNSQCPVCASTPRLLSERGLADPADPAGHQHRDRAAKRHTQHRPPFAAPPKAYCTNDPGRCRARHQCAPRTRRGPSVSWRRRAVSAVSPFAAYRPANSSSSAAGMPSTSSRSLRTSACWVSRWVLTDTYSPSAIDTAPATPVVNITGDAVVAPATPTTRPAVDTIPFLAPSTRAPASSGRLVTFAACGSTAGSVGTGRWYDQARYELYCRVGGGVGKPDCRHRCTELSSARGAKQRHPHRFLIPGDFALTIGCVKGGEAIT
jgi:hypothetical protein